MSVAEPIAPPNAQPGAQPAPLPSSERLARLGPSPLRPTPEKLQQGVDEMSRQAEAAVAGDSRVDTDPGTQAASPR